MSISPTSLLELMHSTTTFSLHQKYIMVAYGSVVESIDVYIKMAKKLDFRLPRTFFRVAFHVLMRIIVDDLRRLLAKGENRRRGDFLV